MISLSKEQKGLVKEKIQQYLADELKIEVGGFDAEFLLDFFAKEIGPFFYNQAINDAKTHIWSQLDNINESLYELEKPINY